MPEQDTGYFWPELVQEADRDLVRRLAHGLYAYPLLLVTLITTTKYSSQHPVVFWGCGLAILSSMAARVLLITVCLHSEIGHRRVRLILLVTIWLVSGGVGMLHACGLWFYGFESWTFTILMQWVVGVASGSTISFTPDFGLMRVHIPLLLTPALIRGLWVGHQQGYVFALCNGLLMVFLLLQGRRLYTSYWQQLRARALESQRSRELETAKLAAEAASVAKGQFLANMSHEIRTPLHGILGMAQLALKPGTSPDESNAYVSALRNSAEGLLLVLNDILDFSKIEAGKLTLEAIPFSLGELVEETRRIVYPQAATKGLALECCVGSEAPDELLGDPARLRQVLINLLGNAAKFTPRGSVRLNVSRCAVEQETGVVRLQFRVTDTGVGIPKAQQTRIFEAFAQGDGSVSRRFGGTGLGLSICSQLVQLMGGQLSVESEPGAGSTFEFTCRFGIGPKRDRLADRSPAGASLARSLQILLAEDNPVNQVIATKMLHQMGHRVKIASTGVEAIRAWEGEPFDLILIDNQMPEMGGVEAVRRIREQEAAGAKKRTAIFALTASALAGDRERLLAAGMDNYLAKPFRTEELRLAIEQALIPAPLQR